MYMKLFLYFDIIVSLIIFTNIRIWNGTRKIQWIVKHTHTHIQPHTHLDDKVLTFLFTWKFHIISVEWEEKWSKNMNKNNGIYSIFINILRSEKSLKLRLGIVVL